MKSSKKYLLLSLIIITTWLQSCTPEDGVLSNRCKNFYDNVPIVGGGNDNYNSYRNNRYKINIANDKSTITVKAEFKGVNGRIYLLNSAGVSVKYSGAGTSSSIEDYVIDKAGIYYIVLNSNESGTYSLDICGSVASVDVINADKKSFDNQNMVTGGGNDAYNSWRNKHFNFDVTEDDSDIDFAVKSKTTNCRMYILNSAGNSIKYSGNGLYELISPLNLKKGTYSIVVCGEEGKSTNFDLAIYSKSGVIINQGAINSTIFSKKDGTFSLAGGIDNFTSLQNRKFTFTANSTTYIDLVGNSSGLNSRIYLLNSAGNSIKYSGNSVSNSIEQFQVTSGTYTVVMCGEKDKSGTFDITLHSKDGAVTDLVPK
jgi:hypothetical protein